MKNEKTKQHRYCYHITDGTSRSALSCGTVTASSMEEAGEIAATRAGLKKFTPEPDTYPFATHWTKDGKRVSVYVLHDPEQ